jgi:hypothetical protein
MKDSKLPQTEAVQAPKNHSFRNMMLLILFVLAIWSWFNYLPQHAMNTLSMLNNRAHTQINTRLGITPIEPVDYSLMLPAQAIPTTSGEIILDGEVNTGDSQTSGWSNTVNVGRSADSQTWVIGSGNIGSGDINTGTTVREEVDAAETTTIASGEIETTISSDSQSVMSITIGWQTITVDGTPDEDIIIKGNWYTVTVQQN